MRKWLIPLAYPFISAFLFLLIGVVGVLGNGDGTGYGGAVIVFGGIVVYYVIIIPTTCFLYSQHFLKGQRFRFLFTIYQSFLIILPCLILFFKEEKTIVYSIILFVWCELWALIGLLKMNRKSKKQNIKWITIYRI